MSEQNHRPRSEVTLDELLSDPMMQLLWRADRITEGDVRRMVAYVCSRSQARRNGLTCRTPSSSRARGQHATPRMLHPAPVVPAHRHKDPSPIKMNP